MCICQYGDRLLLELRPERQSPICRACEPLRTADVPTQHLVSIGERFIHLFKPVCCHSLAGLIELKSQNRKTAFAIMLVAKPSGKLHMHGGWEPSDSPNTLTARTLKHCADAVAGHAASMQEQEHSQG